MKRFIIVLLLITALFSYLKSAEITVLIDDEIIIIDTPQLASGLPNSPIDDDGEQADPQP